MIRDNKAPDLYISKRHSGWGVFLIAFFCFLLSFLCSANVADAGNYIVTVGDVTVNENLGTGTFTITVQLDGAAPGTGVQPGDSPFTLNYSTADGSATAPGDYTQVLPTNVVFPMFATTRTVNISIINDAITEADENFFVNVALTSCPGCTIDGSSDLQAVGTITNDDQYVLSVNDVSTTEGNVGTKTLTFTVSIPVAGSVPISVDYATSSGSATQGTDFVGATGTATIIAGSTSTTFDVTINGDTTVEADETLNVTLSNIVGSGTFVGGDPNGVGTITNDDQYVLSVNDVSTTEGNVGTKTLTFTVSIPVAGSVPISVDYATSSGSATQGTDFVGATGTATIIAGSTSTTFDVTINGDTTVEADETLNVTLSNIVGSGTFVGGDPNGVGTITNDDQYVLSVNDVSTTEGNVGTKTLTFTVSIPVAGSVPISVDYATSSGSATQGSDFVGATGTATIIAGSTSTTFDVTINGDTTVEADETLNVTLSNIVGPGTFIAGKPVGIGTITNDDQYVLSVNDVSTTEGNVGTKTLTFTVSIPVAGSVPISVDYATSSGSATQGTDFVGATGTATIIAGSTSTTFDVTINGDTTVEADETLNVTLSNIVGSGTFVGGDPNGIGTITNDDQYVLSVDDVSTTEGNVGTKTLTFTVSIPVAGSVPISVDYATSSGSATQGTDFVGATGTATIIAGSTSTTFDVTINGDTTVEADETLNVTLSNIVGSGTFVGGDPNGVGTITNDDQYVLSVNDVSTTEGNVGTKTLTFTVSIPVAGSVPISVDYATSSGSATQGTDFVGATGTATIIAGSTSTTFDVTINGDTTVEADETLNVTLSNIVGSGTFVGGDPNGVGTITNDDQYVLSVNDVSTTEGNVGTKTLTFTVSIPVAGSVPISVDYATSSGSATQGTDFVGATGTATIIAGSTSTTFDVTINGDTTVEADETLNVTLSNIVGSGTFVGGDPNGVGTITNDDQYVLSVNDVSTTEGNVGTKTLTFTVSIPVAGSVPISVDYATSSGSATQGTDFVGATGTATIIAGSTSTTFDVTINGDTTVEADETLNVTLSNIVGSGTFVGGDPNGVGTITNDDQYVLSVNDVSTTEGNVGTKTLTFTVSIPVAGSVPISVDYATSSGSATQGTDFVGATGTATIIAGSTSTTFDVTINGDTTVEADETLNVTLSNIVGSGTFVGGDPNGVGTITNDDQYVLSVNDVSTTEGNVGTKTLTFTVSIPVAGSVPISVDYATSSGSAIQGTDFVGATGTATIIAGSTSTTFDVTINGDTTVEADETLNVTLSNIVGSGTFVGGDPNGVGTITNDDQYVLSVNDVSTTEGNVGTKTLTFTVSIPVAGSVPISVDYATSSGSATQGTDFVGATGTATIIAGSTSTTFDVTINGDTTVEADETLNVTLSNIVGSGTFVGGDPNGVGTITNDDQYVLSVNDVSTTEGNVGTKTLTFTVSIPVAGSVPISVDYATSSGSATQGTDFVGATGTATIIAGSTSTTFDVTINGDTTVEADETLNVTLSNIVGSGTFVGGDPNGVGTITNDDQYVLSVNDVSTTEGNVGTKTLTFTVSIPVAGSVPISVDYATSSGSATQGTDFVGATGTATIIAGSTSTTFDVTINGDTTVEADETLNVTLSNIVGSGTFVGGDPNGVGTITNDDQYVLSVNDVSTTEGNVGTKTLTFTVSIPVAGSVPISVDYATSSGSAIQGTDFVGATGTATIIAGSTSTTFDVTINGDTTVEADETLNVTLSNIVGSGTFVGGDPNGVGTITNDDQYVLSVNDVSTTEGNVGTKTLTFTVSIPVAGSVPISVDYATSSGSATQGTDFVGATGTATIIAGSTSTTFDVTINGDTTVEADETLNVTLSNIVGSGTFVGGDPNGVGTITNDDTFGISITDSSAVEGTPVTFTVTLGAPRSMAIALTYNTSDGSATVLDSDYTAVAGGVLNIPAGPAGQTATFTVSTTADAKVEADETFTVTLTTADLNATLTDDQGTGTITNNDTYGVSINDSTSAEGTPVTFTVTLDAARSMAIALTYNTSDGSATVLDSDYTAVAGGVLNIPAGPAGQTATFTVSTTADAKVEADETFTVTLTSADPNATLTDDQGTGTITNNDTFGISINDSSAIEGNPITFTITLDAARSMAVTVTYDTADGTATVADSDYTPVTAGTANFPAGPAGQTMIFTVDTTPDAKLEASETFTVTLECADGNATWNRKTSVGTITNNDYEVSFSALAVSVAESAGNAVFTVALDRAITGAETVTVNYATANGTATQPADYTSTSGTLTFDSGTGASLTISVPIINDTLVEYDETFTLTLSGPSANATIIGGATATGTILIDDLYQISVADVTVGEGDGTATFHVSVTPAIQLGDSVMVSYDTHDITATAGSDYVTASGSLTFAPGETTQNIVVTIINDALLETIETFSANIFTPTPSTITSIVDFAATCSIVENDRTLTIDKAGSGIGSVGVGAGAPSGLPGGTITNASFPQTFIYEAGDVVTLTATPDALPDPGSVFKYWTGDISTSAMPATVTMDDNKLVAAFFAQQYRIHPTLPGPGGAITPATDVIVEHGTDYTFTIDSAAPDYTVVSNVLVDGSSVGSETVPNTPAVLTATYTFTNVTANHILSAVFDDFGDDCSGAVAIGVPPFVSDRGGYIYPAGDADYFQIDIPSYGTLEIYTSGGTDTAGTFLASDCTTIVAYNDDRTTQDNNFYIKQRGLPVGTYFIAVAHWESDSMNPSGTGGYSLHVEFNSSDHGDNPEDATIVDCGSSTAGTIETGGNQDWFRVHLAGTGTLTVYTTGSTDTVGTLYGPDGATVITTDNNSGASPNFRIQRNVPAGDYFVVVSHNDSTNGTGSYTLHVDCNLTFTITASALAGGSISPEGAVLVNQGASRTFTITADGTNSISDVKVDGASVGAVSSYTFTNVVDSHTIVAEFQLPPDICVDISDVPLDARYQAAPANIMFVLDDSGSMDWEVLVQGEDGGRFYIGTTGYSYVFDDPGDDIYSSGTDNGRILGRGSQRSHWKSQWSGHNQMYYNPSVTYDPWPTLSNANPDTPRSHPARSADVFNLSASYDTVQYGASVTATIDDLDSAPSFTKTPNQAVTYIDANNGGSGGYTRSGTATYSHRTGSGQGYNGEYYTFLGSTSASRTYSATWTPDFPVAMTSVNVYARWPEDSDTLTRISSVTYTIHHAGGTTTVTANQNNNPDKWNLLGTFNFNAGSGDVTLAGTLSSHNPAYSVSVDGIKFEPTTGWDWATDSQAYSNHYWWTPYTAGGPAFTATWTPTITVPGPYNVQVRWVANSTRSQNVTYTVNHAAGSTVVPNKNQRLNGGTWVSLGTYNFNAGTGGNVTFSHTPTGTNDTVCADAVRFVQTIQTIDVKNAHYYTWFDANGNGAINPGEVYLVNIDGGSLTYYQFTDADSDSTIDQNELLPVAGNNPPAAVRTGRTYAEERQNFANWYSFYRRRILTATAAMSKSISSMQGVKIGINSINHRIRQPVLSIKVGALDETNTLLNSLYGMVIQANSTPLRLGLREVGQYFDADDAQTGGLGSSPFAAAEDGGECQQAFAIVMTDGYYNDSLTGFGNKDGDHNTSFDGSPYGDTYSNSLADIAMHYYERDLVNGLNNLLPITPEDSATHQHMVTYTVSFGVHGTLNPQSYDFVSTFPTWPDPDDGDPEKIDDLWHAAVNGRGLFLSAGNPQELVDSLLAVMANIGTRVGSSSAVSVNGDELYQTLGADIQMFQATYSSDGWTGDVKAFGVDLVTGQVLTGTPLWSASAELDTQTYDNRVIATFDGVQGQPFRYASLTNELKSLLDSDSITAQNILNYVRGDNTYEQNNGGTFRNRAHKMGDVVHSSPVYEDGFLYAGGNDGMLHCFNAETGVEQFAYVPKHVFDHLRDLKSPAYPHKFYVDLTPSVKQMSLYGDDGVDNDGDGTTDEPDEAVSKTILVGGLGKGGRGFFALDVTDPSSITSEAILKTKVMWEYPSRRIITITNATQAGTEILITTATPHGFSIGSTVTVRSVGGTTEANGNWTVTPTTITSLRLNGSTYTHAYTSGGTVEPTDANWNDIGYSFSKPAIVNSKAGWIVIFGNGYNSSTGIAKLFILDALTGTLKKVINTEGGSCNGLSSPTPTDVNFDAKVDYVYAGDLRGNMWKFDLTSDDINNWGVAYKSGTTPKPLFQAISPEGLPQPITAKPDVMVSCTSERDGYMVLFGTGRYLGEFDMYASITNSLYGVWDYGEDTDDSEYLGIFQRGSTPQLSNQPNSVTLLEQTTVQSTETDPNFFTVTLGPGQTQKVRVVTNNEIDWTTTSLRSGTCAVDGLGMDPCDLNGTGVKSDPAAHAGWYYDLPLDGERVVSDVLLRQGRAIFVPYTPVETPCGSGGDSVIMELEACSGSRTDKPVMDINGDGVIDEHDVIEIAPGVSVPGSGIQAPGRLQPPAILILDRDREKKYSASSKGTIVTITEKAVTLGITHWMEIE